MKVKCNGIVNGYLEDKYGAKSNVSKNGMPGVSIPLEISDAPEGTVSYAIVMDDYDAVPPCGFNWIHWLVCDLKRTVLKEGESGNSTDFTEGCNSWHSAMEQNTIEEATGYGGPAPPDKMHRYTITVYALDKELGLKKGFMMNDLYFAMMGHILDKETIIGMYEP